jgi:hypothetical protein
MPATTTLNEFLLASHFASPLPMTMLDVADSAQFFSSEFPKAHQLPTAPPVDIAAPPFGPATFNFNIAMPEMLPRLVLRSADNATFVMLQADRFAIGWGRTKPLGEIDEYPGFDHMKHVWTTASQRFLMWYRDRFKASDMPLKLMEVAYWNAVLVDEEKPLPAQIGNLFRWIKPRRPIDALNIQWGEKFGPEPRAGRVTVSASFATVPPAQRALAFTFTGLAPSAGSPVGADAMRVAQDLHDRIAEIYQDGIANAEMPR